MNTNLLLKKEKYKSNDEKHVRFESVFAAGDPIFIEQPSLFNSPAECLANKEYAKLLPRRLGPYRVISVGSDYIKIFQDRIENTVFINAVTRTLREKKDERNYIAGNTPRAANEDHSHSSEERFGQSTLSIE